MAGSLKGGGARGPRAGHAERSAGVLSKLVAFLGISRAVVSRVLRL